jgi:hypothetical protein
VHRDIKPDNIMLERATGRALLMDFGISRTITATVEKQGLTRVGEVVGTPEYMSPEQASGDNVDGRSDIYSLGLVALFAMTGAPVITGESTQKILVKQLTESPPPVSALRPDLPAALGSAVDQCVAKLPEERFATAEGLVEAIDTAQLSVAEIPIPVRLFAQEVGTLGFILTFLVITGWLLVRSLAKELGLALAMIPAAMLAAIVLTRFLQASATGRRLAVAGFHPDDVVKGMRAVVEEREGMRAQLRADPDTRRRRRITMIFAGVQIPVAFLLMKLSGLVHFTVGKDANSTVDTVVSDGVTHGPAHYLMAAVGLSLLGVSFILLIRSPFKIPIGERLFRHVWLGFPGRVFLGLSMRGVAPTGRNIGTSGTARAIPQPAPPVVRNTAANKTADPIARLEARVAELETWRQTRE